MKCLTRLLLLLCIACTAFGQNIRKEEYFPIDGFAKACGPMPASSVGFIADAVTKNCSTELQSTRAFYSWMAKFVKVDPDKVRKPEGDNATHALMERKAGGYGFAALFKAFCDYKRIDCKIVSGIARFDETDIDGKGQERRHWWNMVTIDNTKFLIDPMLACGVLYKQRKRFSVEFTDAWWLTNRKIFALNHFPDSAADQNLAAPINKRFFKQAPLPAPYAVVIGLAPSFSASGIIKARADDTLCIQFFYAGRISVPEMFMQIGEGAPAACIAGMDQTGYRISLPLKNDLPPGPYVLRVLAGTKLAYTYKLELKKGRPKRKT